MKIASISRYVLCCSFALMLPCLWADVVEEPQDGDQGVVSLLGEPPTREVLRQKWVEYMQGERIPESQQVAVLGIWDQAKGTGEEEKLSKMVASIAVLNPELVLLADEVRGAEAESTEAEAWIAQEKTSPFLRDPLQLWIALGWIQQGRYAEALTLLEGITTDELVDPVSYAFALSVIYHQRADKQQGLELLGWLQEHQDQTPQRYRVLAELMGDDLQQLKVGSLDDISRRMKQIRQQLGLGRTGEQVLRTEDEVLKMLDKLIEEEAKKQSSESQSVGQGGAPSRPAEESRLLGGKGAGQVTKRPIGKSTGWGDLPPKEREQAMQEISREFPAHYREVIEAYFRELARQQK